MEIDDLLELYLKAKKDKKEAISYQKYEKAASARDSERQYSVKLYELLAKDKVSAFDYNKFDESINSYCVEKYGCSIYDTHSLKQIIRQKRLNDLGI
jgi:predicted cupin superfamily sugar epimerase